MAKGKKFGAFGGVFTPSILSILGVIMYLRLPWIVGHAGLLSAIGIILVAHIISITTGLSIASIATDKKVGTGGSYYIISRSLGLPIGGTLGLALFVGLSFSVSLYIIGFSETIINYFGLDPSINNIRLVGSISLLFILIVSYISTSLAIKTQYLIMTIIGLSLLSVFLGKHSLGPAEVQNTVTETLPWIALFAIFFPAVTGFQAGVSMSGDLKDPRKNIPLGTIAAIIVGLIVYTGLSVFLYNTVDRSLLAENPNILFEISWIPQLVVAGILGATLSSALGSILGAPRILQAISSDKITPSIFAKGFGASNEPRNALIFTFVIALSGILIGELNAIARIVTIFFIIIYGFINITYTAENWASSDFRPSFKIHPIISIIGALACIIVMIQLDLLAMIGATLILSSIFLYLKKRELVLQTGDTWSGIWTSLVKTGLRKLMFSKKRAQSWRPNIILFSGGTDARPHLIEFGKALVGKLGIFTSFQLIEDPSNSIVLSREESVVTGENEKHKDIITRKHVCKNIYEGVETISKIYGFSGFEPNTTLMGWAKTTKNPEKFASLLAHLTKTDFNQVYLKYDKETGFGNYKKIDFWWNGKGRNLAFALSLLKYITASPFWRQAKIRVLIINNETELTESYYTLLEQIKDDQRLDIETKVINNNIEKLSEAQIIKSESFYTDLTILEIPDITNKDAEAAYVRINKLCDPLKTCMIIKASKYFENISLSQGQEIQKKEKADDAILEKEPESIVARIKPVSKEIVANHLFNLGGNLEKISESFLKNYLYAAKYNNLKYSEVLSSFIQKTLQSLEKAILTESEDERNKALLNILNDFAFHAKKQINDFSNNVIDREKELIEKFTLPFVDETRKIVNSLPQNLTIKTGKRSKRKIRFLNTAKYLIYYNRLLQVSKMQESFSRHSFSVVSDLRKLLNNVHELIEKAKNESAANASTVLQMEKPKITVNVSGFEASLAEFYNLSAHELYDGISNDLNSLGHILEGHRSSSLDKRYKKELKKEHYLKDKIDAFPDIWEKGIKTYTNKAYLDFLFLSLNARIRAKILKHNSELNYTVQQNTLKSIEELKEVTTKSLKTLKNETDVPVFDYKAINHIAVEDSYNTLFEEIFEILQGLPESLEINSLKITGDSDSETLKETESYVLGIRKTAEFYISNELIDFAKKESRNKSNALNEIINNVKDSVRLANFNLQANKDKAANDEPINKEDQEIILKELINKLKVSEKQINETISGLEEQLNEGLKKAFEPLSSSVIIKTSRSLKKKIVNGEGKDFFKGLKKVFKQINSSIQKQFVKILYTRSEGILWTEKLEDSSSFYNTYEKAQTLTDNISPKKEVVKSLPFYYTNLFSGFSGIGDDFWVGMKSELKKGEEGVQKFLNGNAGMILISGKRSSGKSSLAKLLSRKFFDDENTLFIRAPKQATSDKDLFISELSKSLNTEPDKLEETLTSHSAKKKVIVINDLGLWWERKQNGNTVVKYILSLIDNVGNNVLFIINVNSSVYKIIEHQNNLSSYTICNINARPFDSRELKELIMLRHKSSGLKFKFNKLDEDEFSEWDYANLFNKFFNVTYGNPGAAIQTWLSCINKVSGKTLYMRYPKKPDLEIIDSLSHEQKFIILQLLLQRRFSLEKIAELMHVEEANLFDSWNSLIRWGIIYEKFNGIYSINPSLEHHLIEKFQNMKLL
ncbi:MAG: amino acid permease [Bacteroidales bacterium]